MSKFYIFLFNRFRVFIDLNIKTTELVTTEQYLR